MTLPRDPARSPSRLSPRSPRSCVTDRPAASTTTTFPPLQRQTGRATRRPEIRLPPSPSEFNVRGEPHGVSQLSPLSAIDLPATERLEGEVMPPDARATSAMSRRYSVRRFLCVYSAPLWNSRRACRRGSPRPPSASRLRPRCSSIQASEPQMAPGPASEQPLGKAGLECRRRRGEGHGKADRASEAGRRVPTTVCWAGWRSSAEA